MYAKGSNTRKQIQAIVESSQVWTATSMELLKGQLSKFVSTLPADTFTQTKISQQHQALQNLMEALAEPFRDMETERKRVAEYQRQGLNMPTTYAVGRRSELQKDGTMKLVDAKAQYISIVKTLMRYVNKVEPEKPRGISNDLNGYEDGQLFASDSYFQQHPDALRLCLYNDDIEVANPLGSRAGVHKITLFYVTVQNFTSSSLKSIHLVLVCYASDLKEYGYNSVLKPFVEDVKLLDKGILVSKGDHRQLLRARLIQLIGDNLAANQTLGMVSSFSAAYYCRFCMMDSASAKHATFQDHRLLRNCRLHQQHVNMLKESADAYKTTGVKCATILDDIPYFSAIEATVPDIMHDILEGVGKRELKAVISALIQSKIISLQQLNDRIASFKFG